MSKREWALLIVGYVVAVAYIVSQIGLVEGLAVVAFISAMPAAWLVVTGQWGRA